MGKNSSKIYSFLRELRGFEFVIIQKTKPSEYVGETVFRYLPYISCKTFQSYFLWYVMIAAMGRAGVSIRKPASISSLPETSVVSEESMFFIT